MVDLKMFIPMCKVDEEKRLVYGIATQEVLDKSEEIMDYDSSKPLFEKWSTDIEKASGGKSVGNLREMHSNKAAGKLTQLNFNDVNKAVEVCAKVVDEESWNKVLEGVLTGFSIGGSYAKRWKDDSGNLRFTADPAEISLVDNPCCPTATFDVIKADGTTEQREFKHEEVKQVEGEVNKDILTEFQKAVADKDLAKAFSFEEITNRLEGALNSQIKTPFNCGYFWIKATYPDYVVICGDIDGDRDQDLYRVDYTMTDVGVITIGTIQEVKMEFVPAVDEDDPNTMAGLPTEKTADTGNLKKQESSIVEEQQEDDIQKADEADNLEKAGAKHSKETMSALQKMAHDLNLMGGACKCEKCMKMYGSSNKSNDDETAKTAQADDLHKAESNIELAKAMEGISALQKAFDGLKTDNEALQKKVNDLENAPLPGGPVLNTSVAMNKSLPSDGQQTSTQEIDELAAWETIINKSTDPQVIQNARMQKAQILMKQTLAGSR